jgi:trehalose 6-phosphate synthase/phosphatase
MKLVIVSNRLPISIREDDGKLQFAESPGGLASGLRSYLNSPRRTPPSDYVWVGWPGGSVRPELHDEAARRCREEYSALPVFLSAEDTEAFYEGFCNHTLWPLFHYFPNLVDYGDDSWTAYERVNRLFADAVLEVAQPGDLVWVHDYHLLLLPAMLKKKTPGLRVGFFLHIPFPSYETFRLLPGRWRSALLQGLLGADLVGFHTHDYTQYFLKCVRRLLGYEHDMGQIILADRVVRAETFPMGVEFEAFSRKAAAVDVACSRDEFRRSLGDCRVILSIDRLDYTKGIADRLLAYEAFLEANPTWLGKAVLLMVVVPSRVGVVDYQRMKSRIDELVGRVNGQFGTLAWTPVLYQYRSLPQDQLVPLYAASEVMLVTPLRDGMNLVAKEYVACRVDETGVLILSEMAGAASELGEALLVNPHDIAGVAGAIKTALEAPAEEQRPAMAAMRRRVRRYDVVRWAGDFLGALQESRSHLDRRPLTPAARERLFRDFGSAGRRLLLLDYDGTLVPLRPTPTSAQPDAGLSGLLSRLSAAAEVVIVSGRSRADLEAWFGGLPVWLVAEHGLAVRDRGEKDWAVAALPPDDWKAPVREVMEVHADRLPRAFVEEKEFSLAWHYRLAEPDLAGLRARELADHLTGLTGTADLKVIEGRKVIEVRPAGPSKGTACQPLLARDFDFVLAVGDDATDEDLFKVLPASAYSVRVGLTKSYARFNVSRQAEARELLEALADAAG